MSQDLWVILELSWLMIIILGSIVGNITVLYVVLRHLQLRTVTNYFIVALSTADLTAALVVMPVAFATVAHGNWIGSEELCVAHGTFSSILGTLSTLVLTCITLERYWSVVRLPKSALGLWFAWLMLGLALVVSVILSLPWALLLSPPPTTSHWYFKEGFRHCMYTLHGRDAPGGGLGYSVTYMVTCGLVPFVLMSTGAVFMYLMIRRSQKRIRPASAQASQLRFSSEVRTAGTVIGMVLLAALTKGPYFIVGLSLAIAGISFPASVDTVAMWLFWTSCTVNPVIYAVRNPNVGIMLNIWRGNSGYHGNPGSERGHVTVTDVPEQGNAYVIPSINVATPSTSSGKETCSIAPDHVDVSRLDNRSDSIPSVLFYVDHFNLRKGSGFSAVTNTTMTTTV